MTLRIIFLAPHLLYLFLLKPSILLGTRYLLKYVLSLHILFDFFPRYPSTIATLQIVPRLAASNTSSDPTQELSSLSIFQHTIWQHRDRPFASGKLYKIRFQCQDRLSNVRLFYPPNVQQGIYQCDQICATEMKNFNVFGHFY